MPPSPENSPSSRPAEPRSRRGTSPTSRPPSARKPSPRSARSRSAPSSSRSTTSRGYAHDPAEWTDIPLAAREPAPGGAAARADVGRPAHLLRRGHHPQDAVEAARRHARRVRPDALPGPGDHVHLLAGRLRHELPVLRHRPGGPRPQPLDRRDRAPDRRRHARAARRRGAGRPGAPVQHRLHGHGRAAGQLQAGRRRDPPPHRPRARRPRPVPARHHRLHRGPGARHAPLRRRGLQVPASR